MLVGMVALTGQWWLDSRKPKKAEVAAHLVNLAWNGLSGLEAKPHPASLARSAAFLPGRTRASQVRCNAALCRHGWRCATAKIRRNGRTVPYAWRG